MKFTEIVENLQEKNPGTAILVKNGIFFVAIGKDAITLNEKIGLKRTCMKDNLCKVGFLVKSSEKYIRTLKDEEISFALYTIDKNTNEPEEILRYKGKEITETRTSVNCQDCKQKQETDEEILERLRNIGK